MKILFLDTSSFYINVAIIEDNKILVNSQELNDNKLSERIFNIIEQVFNKANVQINSINKIYIANGPGSFTGIRIGLTIAKTIAWSLNIPLIPISTLELMVSGVSTENNIALINDRNNYVYAGGYSDGLEKNFNDEFISIVDLLNKVSNNTTFYSYDKIEGIKVETPKIDILKIINKHSNDIVDNVHLLIPNYIKKTDAEKSIINQ